jgi:hypothetical protein
MPRLWLIELQTNNQEPQAQQVWQTQPQAHMVHCALTISMLVCVLTIKYGSQHRPLALQFLVVCWHQLSAVSPHPIFAAAKLDAHPALTAIPAQPSLPSPPL